MSEKDINRILKKWGLIFAIGIPIITFASQFAVNQTVNTEGIAALRDDVAELKSVFKDENSKMKAEFKSQSNEMNERLDDVTYNLFEIAREVGVDVKKNPLRGK